MKKRINYQSESTVTRYILRKLLQQPKYGHAIYDYINHIDVGEENVLIDPNSAVNMNDYVPDGIDKLDNVHIRGALKMDLSFKKTILKEFYFVYGTVTIRDGRYFLQRENLLFLEGVYSIYTNRFYFILKPKKFLFYKMPTFLEQALMNETFLFHGESGAQLAYYSYVTHYLGDLKDLGIRHDHYYHYSSQSDVSEKSTRKESCVYRGIGVGKISAEKFMVQDKQNLVNQVFEWSISGVISSVNCDYTALFTQTFHDNIGFTSELNAFLQIGTILCIFLIFGLFKQIKFTRTRSAATRVSILFVGFTSTLSFITFSASLVFLLNFYEVFTSAIAFSFMSFIYLTASIQYMLFIWKSHHPNHYENIISASVHMRKLFFFFWGFSMSILFGG